MIKNIEKPRKIKEIRKKGLRLMLLTLAVILLAAAAENTGTRLENGNQLKRYAPGEGSQSVSLLIKGEGIEGEKTLDFTLSEQIITQEMAEKAFEEAKNEIDSSIFGTEKPEEVTESLNISQSYADGMVQADWNFDSYEYIDAEGQLRTELIKEELSEKGALVNASVNLTCGDYEEEYKLAFCIKNPKMTEEEAFLEKVNKSLQKELEKPGQTLTLPEEVEGKKVVWSEVNQHLIFKAVFFEIILGLLWLLVKRERTQMREKDRKKEMKLDYSDIVSKLAILLGSGMTIRQSWDRISARYIDKRNKNAKNRRFSYEEMVISNFQMKDGEGEKNAYQSFGMRIGLPEYNRLSRLLVQNLQKGNRGLCQLLDKESELAFQERAVLARKLGEEAGTKMLMPLMMMLVIVIAIIMFPAIVEFKG